MFPLRTDLATRARYSQAGGIQRILPVAVARPTNPEQLQAAIDWASQRGLGVTPRGAGSAMSGSAVGDGLILDLTALIDGTRLELLPDVGLVRAACGVTLAEIAAAAAPHGLRLGPDPSSAPWATVAGAIGTNAAGARSYRLGAMDRWVQSVRSHTIDGPLVLSRTASPDPNHPLVQRFQRDALPVLTERRSTVLSRWPRTRKNSAGYGLDRYWLSGQLLDLLIGSEGTLAVLTGAELRLERIPAQHAALRVALADRRDLADAIAALQVLDPTSIELLDQSLLRVLADRIPDTESAALWRRASAILLVDFESDSASDLDDRLVLAQGSLRPIAIDVRVASDPAAIVALWSVRHHASPALAAITDGRRSLQVIEDGCVPVELLGNYLDAVDAACADAGVDAVMFGHAGDGHVHVNLLPDPSEGDWQARVRTIYQRVSEALLHLGGTPAGEHGAGRLRAGLLDRFLGPEAVTCFAAVKRAFDPTGVLNPGVILADGTDPLDRLKLGATATPLPEGLDAELRRIEEERRWGESRWETGEG